MKQFVIFAILFSCYYLGAGLTSLYVKKFDPYCLASDPTKQVEVFNPTPRALIWPLYWPLEIGKEMTGYRNPCVHEDGK